MLDQINKKLIIIKEISSCLVLNLNMRDLRLVWRAFLCLERILSICAYFNLLPNSYPICFLKHISFFFFPLCLLHQIKLFLEFFDKFFRFTYHLRHIRHNRRFIPLSYINLFRHSNIRQSSLLLLPRCSRVQRPVFLLMNRFLSRQRCDDDRPCLPTLLLLWNDLIHRFIQHF